MYVIAFVESHRNWWTRAWDCSTTQRTIPSPRAVLRVSSRKERLDPPVPKLFSVRLAVISPVGVSLVRCEPRGTHLAPDRRNLVDQRKQLGDVVAVGPGDARRRGRAVGVNRQMVLGAAL